MGPFAGKRTEAAASLLYPRYESVQDLLEGKLSAGPSPAAQLEQLQSKPPAAYVAATTGDGSEPSVEERKRIKREKRALRRVNVDGASPAGGVQGEGTAAAVATSPEPGSKAAKKEEKKRKRAEQMAAGAGEESTPAAQQQQTQQQQEASASAAATAKGNAEEARRIREALGYVPADSSKAQATQAAAPTSMSQPASVPRSAAAEPGSKRFAFGFNIQQQKENEADAKIARLMAMDSTKDGYVTRRVWLCGMPHEFSEEDVKAYWEECGPIESMDLLKFKDTGRFNGAAFVTFKTEEGYAAALACNGEELEGRRLKVDKCKMVVPRSQQATNPDQAYHLALNNGLGHTALPPQIAIPIPPPSSSAPAQPATQQQDPAADEHVAYVGNVAFEATQEELQGLFAPYNCTLIRLHTDKNSGRPKGFAHAHFADRASLQRAVESVDGASLHDRSLKVAIAAPKKNKS